MNINEVILESSDFKCIILESNDDLIDYAKILSNDLGSYGLSKQDCDWRGIFRYLVNEGKISNKKSELINRFKRFDERSDIKIKTGASVSILNLVISENFSDDKMYLYGFVDPKTITKIYRDPDDNKITQIEFNNDPYDVYPRKYRGIHNGDDIDHSIFFKTKSNAVHAITLLKISGVDIQGIKGI
jgi:hypothetical protein